MSHALGKDTGHAAGRDGSESFILQADSEGPWDICGLVSTYDMTILSEECSLKRPTKELK